MTDHKNEKTAILRASARARQISAFIAMDVLAKANQKERAGEGVIHMEVGQPSSGAPQSVTETARKALAAHHLGYTEAVGIPLLREKIARSYHDRYGVAVDPERVIVTTGSSGGFVLAFLALLEAGGRVGLAAPGYPCYRHILRTLGNDAVLLNTDGATRWAPTVESLKSVNAAASLDAILIASPANPTGTMLTPERLQGLVKTADTLGMWFISDEIYHGLTYEMPARTALEFSDNAIIINSFSKYYAMTGWRVGWMIVPEVLVRTMERLQQNLYICAPTVSQIAAVAAFEAVEEMEARRDAYEKNRDILLDVFEQVGLGPVAPPDGAFYLYADISKFAAQSADFADMMLSEIGVAVTPGLDFDEARGGQYLRFSYAGGRDDIEEAAKRIKVWLGARG